MMNALLVLSLWCQDADVAVTGHGRRIGGEYELTVSGKGKGLKDQEAVNLRFRRVAHRVVWEDGVLVSEPAGDEISRAATVDHHAFVHRERFAAAGEVEVRIGRSHPDGAPDEREIRKVFRLSSFPEEAHAIGGSVRRVESAIRGVRLLVADLEMMKEECPAARKQAQVRKRIDWRKAAYREEIADVLLTASAQSLSLLLSDMESADELDRSGKGATMLVSSLTGKPFAWDELRSQIDAIEAISLRERALLIARVVGALARDLAVRVASGEAGSWARAERDFTRTIDALRDFDQAWRSGPSAERYAALGDTLAELLATVPELIGAAGASLRGPASEREPFADAAKSVIDRAAAVEQHVRSASN